MTMEEITARIRSLLPDAQVSRSGEDCHLTLTVVSSGFAGKGLLARHRLVQGAFREELASGSLHALSLVTRTPEEMAEA